MTYLPQCGDFLIVTLPGEMARMPVVKVVNQHTVLCELQSIPLSRQHMYRRGDMIPARRVIGPLGEAWEAIDERLMLAQQAAESVAKKGKHHAAKAR